MKKNSILIAVLGTLLLVLGIVINFVININNKNKELKDTKNEIITNYSKLEEDITPAKRFSFLLANTI